SVSLGACVVARTASATRRPSGENAHTPANPFRSKGLPARLSETGLRHTREVPVLFATMPSRAVAGDALSSRGRGEGAEPRTPSATSAPPASPPIRTRLTRPLHRPRARGSRCSYSTVTVFARFLG